MADTTQGALLERSCQQRRRKRTGPDTAGASHGGSQPLKPQPKTQKPLARGQFRPQSPSTQDEAQARPALRKRTSADAVTAFDQQ